MVARSSKTWAMHGSAGTATSSITLSRSADDPSTPRLVGALRVVPSLHAHDTARTPLHGDAGAQLTLRIELHERRGRPVLRRIAEKHLAIDCVVRGFQRQLLSR